MRGWEKGLLAREESRKSQDLRGGSPRDSVRPKHLRNHAGSGGSGVERGSGSPVSCRKGTSVIPQVSTVCPVRTRTPGVRSAQGAIASAPGPTRKKRSEGRALRGAGLAATRGLADTGCGRGRIEPGGRLLGDSCGNRPSSQQVPEEAGGGARRARSQVTPQLHPPPHPT